MKTTIDIPDNVLDEVAQSKIKALEKEIGSLERKITKLEKESKKYKDTYEDAVNLIRAVEVVIEEAKMIKTDAYNHIFWE